MADWAEEGVTDWAWVDEAAPRVRKVPSRITQTTTVTHRIFFMRTSIVNMGHRRTIVDPPSPAPLSGRLKGRECLSATWAGVPGLRLRPVLWAGTRADKGSLRAQGQQSTNGSHTEAPTGRSDVQGSARVR